MPNTNFKSFLNDTLNDVHTDWCTSSIVKIGKHFVPWLDLPDCMSCRIPPPVCSSSRCCVTPSTGGTPSPCSRWPAPPSATPSPTTRTSTRSSYPSPWRCSLRSTIIDTDSGSGDTISSLDRKTQTAHLLQVNSNWFYPKITQSSHKIESIR